MYSSAHSIAEVGFEENLQPLKDVLTKHTYTNVHISDVHNVLAGDWAWRVTDICN